MSEDKAVGVNDEDETPVYESEEGRRLTFAQIAMAGARDPTVTVEPAEAEDGYYYNGTLYTPLGDNEPTER